jgi:5-methyltetrahydropteroyltriglutamate--homocysteine methyltransferase
MAFNVDSTLTGIHSRSERTVRATRDFDRGRTSKDILDAAFESDSSDLVNLEIVSGITRISDGQLMWQDFIRPFSESIQGLRRGADLSRWYDTNSFYRKPSVVGKLSMPKDATFLGTYENLSALKLVKSDKLTKRKLSLPGPYTLASLVSDEFYDSKTELVNQFAKILKKILPALKELGFGAVQINEPSLVYRYGESALKSKKELKSFISAYEDNLSNPPVEITLQTYFGDCSKILKDLLRLDGITALGIDFTQTSLDTIEKVRFGEMALACGCVDGRNSLVEPAEWIADFSLEAIHTLKPNGIVVLPSSELKYLPRAYADEKVRAIGKACKILKSKLK